MQYTVLPAFSTQAEAGNPLSTYVSWSYAWDIVGDRTGIAQCVEEWTFRRVGLSDVLDSVRPIDSNGRQCGPIIYYSAPKCPATPPCGTDSVCRYHDAIDRAFSGE